MQCHAYDTQRKMGVTVDKEIDSKVATGKASEVKQMMLFENKQRYVANTSL